MLAIIPARGGSKGLIDKNIKLLNGKPLVSYSIEAAKQSKYITEIVVSTNDKGIAEVAAQFGAPIPFFRPEELSQDNSLAVDTYIYTVQRLNESRSEAEKITEVIILLPTAPLRTAEDIDKAIEMFQEKKADSVVSWAELPHPVEWCKKIDSEGRFVDAKMELRNRQDYTPSYFPVGVVYVFKFDLLLQRKYYTDNSYAYILPKSKAVEIDTIEDFLYAETLMKYNELNK